MMLYPVIFNLSILQDAVPGGPTDALDILLKYPIAWVLVVVLAYLCRYFYKGKEAERDKRETMMLEHQKEMVQILKTNSATADRILDKLDHLERGQSDG